MQEFLNKAEVNHSEYERKMQEISDYKKELVQKIKLVINEMKPVYDFIYSKRYLFQNEELDISFARGPVFGIDNKEDEIIYYDVKTGRPYAQYKFNLDREPRYIQYMQLVEMMDIDKLIERAKEPLNHYKAINYILEREIDKYSTQVKE